MKFSAFVKKKKILLILSSLFFLSIVLSSYLLKQDKLILKEGLFPINNDSYEFNIKNLLFDKYQINFVVSPSQNNDWNYKEPMNLSIMTELKNNSGNILKKQELFEHGIIAEQFNGPLMFNLMTFRGKLWQKYKLKITMQNQNKFFERHKKEIYIIEDRDLASLPYVKYFRYIMIFFLIIAILLLIKPDIQKMPQR
ncbi:MAG: hypothetical protein ABSG42_01985 [Nitrospirota bacterium]